MKIKKINYYNEVIKNKDWIYIELVVSVNYFI